MKRTSEFSDKAKKDYELVKQAQKGSQAAFTELMNRYHDAIFYMIYKMINDKSDAEDLTIEAFGKAFRKIEQYSPDFAFSTWLFRIASNNCIDFLRKKKSRQINIDTSHSEAEGQLGSTIYDESTISIKSPILDPEESLIKEQKNIQLRSLVDSLKPRYKRLVELRYFKEYSYEEISQELNIPIGTVKAQLFRARELLYGIVKKRKGRL
jgi:RNA polymerase sigma-70 factor (ECF subfamily)